MRLLSKISYYYFWLSVFVLGITGFFLFLFLRSEILAELEEQLELQTDMIAEELAAGRHVNFPLVNIRSSDENLMHIPKVFRDTLIYDRLQNKSEGYYYFEESKRINNTPYRIRVMTTFIGWENYSKTITYIFIAIAATLVLLGTLVNYFISRKIWAPFLINLNQMKGYSVSSDEELRLTKTDVKEFQEMNAVLSELAARGKKEYTALKQFTENASHEIQTPLSIIKTRLESITQLPLDKKMISLLSDAKIAVTRLSKVSKGLLLLAKLENDTFVDKDWIVLKKVINKNLDLLEDLIQNRNLKIKQITSDKKVFVSSTLMDILISNLLSNIINYSRQGACVLITVDDEKLVLSNEGPPLMFPSSNLFSRFSKSTSKATKQNGLGLAIVKQICVSYNWTITYNYQDNSHIFSIYLA